MILIVDDIADSCDIMSRHLRREGYEVACAQSAGEAFRILRSTAAIPQLIILDVMMPETDGRAVLRELRKDERLKDVPVLACTANASYACTTELLALGAQGCLVKGLFDRECFLHCVERYGGPPRRLPIPAPSLQAPAIPLITISA